MEPTKKERKLAAARKRYSENPEKYRAAARARYNPERGRAYAKQYRLDHSEVMRDRDSGVRRAALRAGVDPDTVPPRPPCCEVCGATPTKRALHLDHCHSSAAFRGWLCNGCNTSLGGARDSAKVLRLLADYVERA